MQGIILNTEQEFNSLNDTIHQWALVNIPKYKAVKWANPIIGQDGKYLLIVDTLRLNGFDFSGYTIVDVTNNTNFFPESD